MLLRDSHLYSTRQGIFPGDSANPAGTLIDASKSAYLLPLSPDGKTTLAINFGSISRS